MTLGELLRFRADIAAQSRSSPWTRIMYVAMSTSFMWGPAGPAYLSDESN
ncbi:hypothetical protein [Dactylosporangium darangshiense]